MTSTNSITWAVYKNEGTATIFCMQCREQFITVKMGEAAFHMDQVRTTHSCVPKPSWKVVQK